MKKGDIYFIVFINVHILNIMLINVIKIWIVLKIRKIINKLLVLFIMLAKEDSPDEYEQSYT